MKSYLLEFPFRGPYYQPAARAARRTRLFSSLLLLIAIILSPLPKTVQAAPPLVAASPLVTPATTVRPAGQPASQPGILPLAFVPNAGQSPNQVLYQVQTTQGQVSFNAQGASFALPTTSLDLTFQNASPQALLSGEQRLAGQVNFYQGSDRSAWKTGIPTYQQIRYRGLYAGIDLTYTGVGGQLKSTYTLAPGADPQQIRWSYHGAQSVQVDSTGSLLVTTSGAQARLVEQAPVAWQIAGSRQIAVSAAYHVDAQGAVSFDLGAYDPSLPLVIDPVLAFSTYMAGNNVDVATAVTTDSQGNVFVGGYTRSTTFMGVPGATGTEDTWIAKLNPQGTTLVYLTYLTGSDSERPNDMVLDESTGNLYIAGYTSSDNFPTLNPAQPNRAGFWDFFVTKLNSSGQITYSTFLGTNLTESAEAIALGPDKSIHVAGEISGKAGLYKLAPDGHLLYGILFGGTGYAETNAMALAVNQNGEVYMTGTTSHLDLDLVPDSMQIYCDGVNVEYRSCRGDAYILKLSNAQDIAGLQILYNTYFGGISFEDIQDMALGSDGSVYLVGQTISSNFPTTANAYEKTCPSGVDPTDADQCTNYEAFFTHISPSLTQVVYSTYIGGEWKETATAVGIDSTGAAYVAGWTEGNDWPLIDSIQGHSGGICYSYSNLPRFCIDSFIVKFDASSNITYSTYLGGVNDDDFIYEIAVDAGGTATVVGSTLSPTFPTTPGTVQSSLPFPGQNGFATKISGSSTPPPPPPACYALTLTTSGSGSAPTANPGNSTGCAAGTYKAGEVVQLTASPAAGWHVGGWTGADQSNTASTNQVTMPAANATVRVNYVHDVQPGFDNFSFLPYIGR